MPSPSQETVVSRYGWPGGDVLRSFTMMELLAIGAIDDKVASPVADI